MNGELPHGWIKAPLREIAAINPRHSRTLADSMAVSFAPMAGVSESKPDFEFLEERPLGKVRQGFTHFADGDVLFAKITPCMENGKGAVATGLRNGLGCGTTELIVIRPLDGIEPHYVYRFLAQPSVRAEAREHFTSTAGQARVPTSFIEELQIPLAPVNEQRRIVSKLEALIAKVDVSRERLQKIAAILKRFRQSVLAAACSGRLTADWRKQNPREAVEDNHAPDSAPDVPETWGWKCLSEISAIKGGVTKGRRFNGKKTIQLPYLRVANVQDGYLDLTEIKLIDALPDDKQTYALQVGDLLFTEGGDRDKLGRGTVWRGEIADCIHQNHIFRARLTTKDVVPDYASLASRSDFSRQYYFENASQTVNLASINLTMLGALPVPIPPLDEQEEIVRRVTGLFARADTIEARHAKAQAHVEGLTGSLLAKAFRAELVPTEAESARQEGRDYEPASALLERIQKERSVRDNAEVDRRGRRGPTRVAESGRPTRKLSRAARRRIA